MSQAPSPVAFARHSTGYSRNTNRQVKCKRHKAGIKPQAILLIGIENIG